MIRRSRTLWGSTMQTLIFDSRKRPLGHIDFQSSVLAGIVSYRCFPEQLHCLVCIYQIADALCRGELDGYTQHWYWKREESL